MTSRYRLHTSIFKLASRPENEVGCPVSDQWDKKGAHLLNPQHTHILKITTHIHVTTVAVNTIHTPLPKYTSNVPNVTLFTFCLAMITSARSAASTTLLTSAVMMLRMRDMTQGAVRKRQQVRKTGSMVRRESAAEMGWRMSRTVRALRTTETREAWPVRSRTAWGIV